MGATLVVVVVLLFGQCCGHYAFKEYSYVSLPKYVNDQLTCGECCSELMDVVIFQETFFREYQSACQQSPLCQSLDVVDHVNCVRECISPSCFIEIYQNDKVFADFFF